MTLAFFHFLRPWWLLLVPVAVLVWWWVRVRATARPAPPAGIAVHLAAALTIGGERRRRLLPIDGVAATLVLLALAAAGPTWSRVPNPLVAQTAPLAVALALPESILTADVAPSRLERAKHKLLDLLARRAGGRTALIAYAGTAHRVVPLTEDPEVLKPFIEGLTPDVMPEPGRNATAALTLAREALAGEKVPGAILFVVDGLDRADLPAFERRATEDESLLVFLLVGGDAVAHRDLQRVPGAVVVRVTPDTADVDEIDRRVAQAFQAALAGDERLQWDDRGWMVAWPAAVLTLLWFRRGWTTRWAFAVAAFVAATQPSPAHAGALADLLLTPDQQGRLAFAYKRYAEAAERFEDPVWKGYALYTGGKYTEAAEVFARVPSAEAAFAQGVAHVKGREYRQGITAFEVALERDPTFAAAARNLEVAEAILAYLEKTREESDTGEGSLGADEVVFDKEAEGGFAIQVAEEQRIGIQTAEQWMRTVDTRTSDFLRIRFGLEAASGEGTSE